MMLSILGFGMVITFMYLIMSKRLSPLVALITIPILFALIGGFGAGIDEMMLEGIKKIAPTGVMLMFAILYFGVMIDAGLFDPLVRVILRFVKGDPMKIVLGTAVLAMLISLDGDGSTTYMITVSAMLPLYQRLGMSARIMTCVTILAGGVMNMTPWGGPTARAATALHVDPADMFVPLIPAMVIACAGVLLLVPGPEGTPSPRRGDPAQGRQLDGQQRVRRQQSAADRGRRRGHQAPEAAVGQPGPDRGTDDRADHRRAADAGAVHGRLRHRPGDQLPEPGRAAPPRGQPRRQRAVGGVADLRRRHLHRHPQQHRHGRSDVAQLLAVIPESWGPYLAVITAVASMPFTFFMSNDAFYFGVLPILSEAASNYGITPVEMARASLAGQPVHLLSPLVPSTYLLVGLAKVEFADHQKFTLKWAIAISMLLMIGSLLFGLYPLAA
jgi:CitMHS family citrate-Mg2+:H+ or citrate-Ca2+:H+ symporter